MWIKGNETLRGEIKQGTKRVEERNVVQDAWSDLLKGGREDNKREVKMVKREKRETKKYKEKLDQRGKDNEMMDRGIAFTMGRGWEGGKNHKI